MSNTENFIKENYRKLGLSKRFIGYSEIMEIKEEYNLNEDILVDLIDEANDVYIESQKHIVLKEFKHILSSYDKFIDKEFRSKLRKRFYTRYYDYYREMNFDDKIDTRNKIYVYSKKSLIQRKYNSILSNGYIDESKRNHLKSKLREDNFDFNDGLNIDKFIDELNKNFIESEGDKILKQFNSFLNSYDEFITDKTYSDIKLKYSNSPFNFFDKFNLKDRIIEKNKILICDNLNQFFSSDDKIIDNNTRFEFKSKYNTAFYKFYDKMGLDDKIDKHNNQIKPKLIKKVFVSADGSISASERSEIKSKYSGIIDWDLYIDCYNKAYINETASIDNTSFKYMNVNGKIDLDITCRDVYYVHTYIQESRWNQPGLNRNEVRNSRLLLSYKNGSDKAIDFFTRDLIKSVTYLSNNVIDDEVKYLALVAIPPSDKCENANASVRKSINHIKMLYDEKRMPDEYDYDKIICDYGNLLYRFISVPKSRSRNRVRQERHVNTILCTRKNFIRNDMAFILMDDITTKGTIMYACEQVLINNGVKRNNIYKLAIAETELVNYV